MVPAVRCPPRKWFVRIHSAGLNLISDIIGESSTATATISVKDCRSPLNQCWQAQLLSSGSPHNPPMCQHICRSTRGDDDDTKIDNPWRIQHCPAHRVHDSRHHYCDHHYGCNSRKTSCPLSSKGRQKAPRAQPRLRRNKKTG